MGIRGELFTNQVNLDKRSYYFNVKENRNGDVFLQIVESKIKDGQDERRDIVVFADDMKSFLGGMDESLRAVEKIQKEFGENKSLTYHIHNSCNFDEIEAYIWKLL